MTPLSNLRRFLGRHRRLAVVGVAVVVAASLIGVLALLADGPEETATGPPSTTTTAPPPVAPLTGMTGDFGGRLRRPALIVKIDNVELARPQAGLNQADIVIEERVEGGLTRLAAVFHSTDASPVGPVRSVRTTDLELIPLFGRPLFASSGGNQGVLPQLRAANVVDIGVNVSSEGFYRDSGRPVPHNLFSSTPALYRKAPEHPRPPEPVFAYLGRGERLPTGATPVGGVALRFGGPEVSRFTWDAGSRTWLRSQRGSPHVDAEGKLISPENVVIAEIGYDLSGQRGRSVPHGVVTGRGRVVVLTSGKAIEGTWVRPTLADPLELVTGDGEEIRLSPGQTFIELPPPGGWSFI
ncbi:MAG TPA: DUF3048 domain-containing protein [Acidimicrobiales bacterium]